VRNSKYTHADRQPTPTRKNRSIQLITLGPPFESWDKALEVAHSVLDFLVSLAALCVLPLLALPSQLFRFLLALCSNSLAALSFVLLVHYVLIVLPLAFGRDGC
jgi:hypothetical protein